MQKIGRELRSCVTAGGQLILSLQEVTPEAPGPDEVIVQVEASPINPSDLGLLLGPADLSTLRRDSGAAGPSLVADIPAERFGSVAGRLGQSLPVGNEGAGVVVDAGEAARDLVGAKVAAFGGGMYTRLRRIRAADCLRLPDDLDIKDGASAFVNPLTALAMIETTRREGHRAIVHTAAASNLGQMLSRLCAAEDIHLVNIVRSRDQAELLQQGGARFVVNSGAEQFAEQLTELVAETGATIAFDAVGGGDLANVILHAMETAANRAMTTYNRYGGGASKQVYIYGNLDVGPTLLDRRFGFAWSCAGFLLPDFLAKAGPERVAEMKARVLRDLRTIFPSTHTHTITFDQLFDPDVVRSIARKATGQKYLIDPSRS